MFQTASQAGFNLTVLQVFRHKRQRRIVLRLGLVLLVFGAASALFVDYLAQLPRERNTRRFSYWQRVRHGGEQMFSAVLLTLGAHHSDRKESKLPIAEIYIRGNRLDNLSSDLPESGGVPQKANVKIGGNEYAARVRFRGDSVNHWAFPQKSWRAMLSKGKFHNGVQVMNFNVPRVRTQISNWLGYQMASHFPLLLVPEALNYHFRLNRRFDGIRLFLEQPNQDFLTMKRTCPRKDICRRYHQLGDLRWSKTETYLSGYHRLGSTKPFSGNWA